MFSIHYNSLIISCKEKGKNSQRLSKIKSFVDKCYWEVITYPWEKDDWNKIRKKSNRFNRMLKIYPTYVSKSKSNLEKEMDLLMIPNRKGWHYLAVKRIICNIKRNKDKTPRWLLMDELPSFFRK